MVIFIGIDDVMHGNLNNEDLQVGNILVGHPIILREGVDLITITRHQNTERIRRYHYNVDVNKNRVKTRSVGYKDFLPGDLEYELYKQKLFLPDDLEYELYKQKLVDMRLWNYQDIKNLVQKVLNT